METVQKSLPYTIRNCRKVEYGKVRMLFDLRIGPVTLLECNLVVDDNERPKFVAPARVRDKFTNVWKATTEVDRDVLKQVFADLSERYWPNLSDTRRRELDQSEARATWATDQEARLERAHAELGSAS